MHELPVTQTMLNMALEHANGRRISDVYLQAGRMSAIVPESVEVFFEYLSKGTLAQGAKLHFEILPVEMACSDCGRALDLGEWAVLQPHVMMQRAFDQGCECGSKNLKVTGGVGFGLVSIDVKPDPGPD